MSTPNADDPPLDEILLHKANALIRRNRPDGVGLDSEELPMLTEIVEEELPELTDAVLLPASALDSGKVPARVQEAFSLSLDLDDDDQMPTGSYQRLSPMPPEEVIRKAVNEATERTRAEMRAIQLEALQEAVAQARDEMRAQQAAAIQEAVAQARADAINDARQMQQSAIQAAIRQGREEAEINQWPAIQAAREEAVQAAAGAMSERLIELDAHIAQSVNQWLAKELPPIIASELLGLSERLKVQASAHMRATLLPELSDQVGKVLESALKGGSQD